MLVCNMYIMYAGVMYVLLWKNLKKMAHINIGVILIAQLRHNAYLLLVAMDVYRRMT